jgi:enoyl-CoA hydratase/carnithine racemase
MNAYQKIKTKLEDGVFTLRLNYPERRNAIGPQMVNELLYALEEAKGASVIVLSGEGKAFCVGGDFSQMPVGAADTALPPKGDFADLLRAMTESEIPIVARVHGMALGGGIGLTAASTFAVAAKSAELGTPEINVGFFPMMIMAVLSRVVPRRRLLEMMLFGERMSAEEAKAASIVNQVVPDEELDAAVKALCDKIKSKSPKTIALGLRAYADQGDMAMAEALPMLRGRLVECLATDDAREGLMAFMEKRKPNWTGR